MNIPMNITEFEKVLDEVAPMAEAASGPAWPSSFSLDEPIERSREALTRLYNASVALVTAEAFSTYYDEFNRLYRKSLEALEGK